MDVELYVYDLTHGMARNMSRQFLGIQIDAVYHTSLVFDSIEYFFGAGVQTCRPGTTHHGQPMEKIKMGTTHLPLDTILEYLDGLKQIYTPESYDLFAHNCNNFTNDFAMFLVGRGIPDHITSLPKRVLDTPFGQMLKPQLDASMRTVTQTPVAPQHAVTPGSNGVPSSGRSKPEPQSNGHSAVRYGAVISPTSLSDLQNHLKKASDTCATVFFTSSTCAPCRVAYPTFDNLAAEHPNCLFLKTDINAAHDIASKYSIRATPTFVTFAKGNKQDEWQGADPNLLKMNVESMINATFPPHRHAALRVPSLQFGSLKPVTYGRTPPLDKLMAKLGDAARDPELQALKTFIDRREGKDIREAPLPDLKSMGSAFRTRILELPIDVRFAAVDLLRCAMVDVRVSGYFAEEAFSGSTVRRLLEHVVGLNDCPHNLRLVAIHLASNLFASPLFVKELMKDGNRLSNLIVQLIASALLDTDHSTTRVAAASLAFNLAASNYKIRREESREGLAEGEQVELAASLIETISTEQNADSFKALLLALGFLLFYSPENGELIDLCHALNAKDTVAATKQAPTLAKEVASLL